MTDTAQHAEARAPDLRSPISPRRDRAPLLWGIALLTVGGIWLLSELNVLGNLGAALVAGGVLGGLAALCLRLYARAPERRWGLLVPAGFFASLAVVAVGETLRILPGMFVPAIFFAGPAAAFYVLYQREPSRNWAMYCTLVAVALGVSGSVAAIPGLGRFFGLPTLLWGIAAASFWYFLQSGRDWSLIPAGLFATLGVTRMLSAIGMPGRLVSATLLLGIGATFGLLHLLGLPGRRRWAAIPAIGFAVIAGLVLLAGPLLTVGLPLALVAVGAYLLFVHNSSDRRLDGDGSGRPPEPPPVGPGRAPAPGTTASAAGGAAGAADIDGHRGGAPGDDDPLDP